MSVVCIICFFPLWLVGQDTIKIAFNEKIQLNLRNNHFDFRLDDNGTEVLLSEKNINDYEFKTMGLYVLEVLRPNPDDQEQIHDCSRAELPDTILVYVDSVRITFDKSSMTTSKPILKNRNALGTELYIDVVVENYTQRPVNMNRKWIRSAGIGSEITASLDESFRILSPGKYTLKYHLNGICTQASYIQFDFIHHSGRMEPIGLSKPVLDQ